MNLKLVSLFYEYGVHEVLKFTRNLQRFDEMGCGCRLLIYGELNEEYEL